MTSKILSDEKENLLRKIPPTVNVEVVEDFEEDESQFNREFDKDESRYELNENNLIRKTALVLPKG